MRQAAVFVRKPITEPAAPVVVVPPAPSKRAIILSLGIVALLAIVFWACDGFLLVRVRAIANEAHAKSPSNPLLTVDDVDALDAYPPRRLSQCLWVPSVQMRTVLCLAIGRRQTWKDSESWVGVVPALLKAFRESNDPDFQITVMQPLLSMTFIPPEDVSEILRFADEQLSANAPSWMICAHLLSVAAESVPDQRSNVLETFKRSLDVPVAQYESMRRLARLAPSSSEAADAVRAYTRSYPPTRGYAGTPEMRAIVLRQPALIDELLGGTTNQQLAVLGLAADDLFNITTALKDPATFGRRPSWLTPDRLQRMRGCALDLSRRTNDRDVLENPDALYGFLRYWHDGPELLFDLARKATGKNRALALRYSAFGANLRPKSSARQFFASIMPHLMQWLNDGDVETRRAALFILSNPYEAEWLKQQPKESKDALLAACRKTLDQSPGDYDFVSVSLMAGLVDEFDAADADRIAAAIERGLLVLKQGYERTGFKPQGAIHEVHRRLFDRLGQFETRPGVARAVKLRRNLEEEGIAR